MQTNKKTAAFGVGGGTMTATAEAPGVAEARRDRFYDSAGANSHDKVKICFYNHTGSVSGAEKVLFSILSALDREKYEGVMFAPKSEAFESICRSTNVAFHPVTLLNARYTLNPVKLAVYLLSMARMLSELRTKILRESPDLVHANTTRAAIVATLATMGSNTSVLWYLHDILPKHPISTIVRLLAVLSGRNRLIAVSNATADAFRGKLPAWMQARAPLEVIYNGTDCELFNTNREGALPFLEETGLKADHFRIGIVGQITPRKGHLELIQTLAPLFKTSLPHGRLLVVGAAMFNNDKEYLDRLKTEAYRLGIQEQVMFLGPRHVPTVMKALNVLVLNSSAEPFGLVLTEAMASGTPVVGRAVDGVLEIVEDNVSGLLFAPGDMKTLTAHLLALSQDTELVSRLARGGRARVEARFDQRLCQAKVLERYESYARTYQALSAV